MKVTLTDDGGTTLTFLIDEDGDLFVCVDDGTYMGPVSGSSIRRALAVLEAEKEANQ